MPQKYANQGEVRGSDEALLPSPTGREDHLGMAEAPPLVAGEIKKPVGAQPRSEVTGRHDAGSDANETIDGLNSTDEALRRAAEESVTGEQDENIEDVPVFDRAEMEPKI